MKDPNVEAEKEEYFWEDRSITDEPDISLFLQNIREEEDDASIGIRGAGSI